MIRFADFEDRPKSGRFYSGNAGRKVGVRWRDADWILKFPGPTGKLQGSAPSYTTAPISEFLESQMYGLKYIPSGQDGDCTAALLRFMDRFSLEACCDLVDFSRTKPLGS